MINRKCLSTILLTVLLCLSSFSIIYAENPYIIADTSKGTIDEIEQAEKLSEALKIYNNEIDNYDNLVILNDNKIIKMEYGIVEFLPKSDGTNYAYESSLNGSAYINSVYVSDAAYIDTTDNAKTIYFKLAGDIGRIGIDEVNLIPYEMLNVRISKYSTHNNYLHHDINNNLNNDYYAYSIKLDIKPDYLNDESSFYSYDGHYFYYDFKSMIDDYRSSSYDNAINSDNPYYNYYQYLPHRSYTNYNLDEVENYFTNKLFIDGKIQFYDDLNLDNANDDVNLSQYYGELNSFFGYEKIYGANALMMLSLSTHESAYGKSFLAFSKNNLFGHAAYDSDVERSASRYNKIDTSIYSHAKYYISRSYAGIHSNVYHGSFFGDKLSGMNVMYASDPYWGEKAAANYFRFDEALGLKDKNSYALGIVNINDFSIYQDEELKTIAFNIEDSDNYALILLEELPSAYKVQVDPSYNDEYLYNPETSVGYINKDNIGYIVNKDRINEPNYKEVRFDFAGGQVIEKERLEVLIKDGQIPSIPSPTKIGYEFIGYDNALAKTTNEYEAQYKKVKNIEVYQGFNNVIEYGYFYNLKGGKIKVNYEDDTSNIIDIDTNMIESYDPEIEGDTILTINYCGIKAEYPVTFSKEINEYRNNINTYIEKNINSYKTNGTYSLDELIYIKDNIHKVDYLTSFDDIRYIDKMLLENTRDDVNYHFKDSKYDVSISGLALSLKDPKQTSIFKPFKDTYYVEVGEVDENAYKRLSDVAKAYDFEIEDSIKVSVQFNLEKAKFDNPIIIQVKLMDKKKDKIYSVYHLDDDGNVIKCMTTQSINYVSFMTRSEGDFMILSMDSVNTYDIEDRYENMSINNADPDNQMLLVKGLLIAAFGLLGFIMIISINIVEKKKEKIWNDYKKSLLQVALPQEEKQKN